MPLPHCSCLFVVFARVICRFHYMVTLWVLFWLIVSCGMLSFLSSSFPGMFLLMLCLVVMAGFKVGGGEAIPAQDQPGTSREGSLLLHILKCYASMATKKRLVLLKML